MKLSKLKIYNYRSFGKEEVVNFEEITSFIGNNSSGKTSALTALQKLFGSTSADRSLNKADFHVSSDEKIDDIESKELYIEAVFTFPELENDEENSLAIPLLFEKLTVEGEGEKPYLRIRLEASWNKGTTLEGTIDSRVYYITQPESDEDIQDSNKHNAMQQDLSRINLIYVPAARNPSSQLKNASGSILYRVLSNINWSSKVTENIKTKVGEMEGEFEGEEGIKIIKNAIKTDWTKYHNDNRYSSANLRFNSSDLESMLKKVEVEFTPTYESRAYNVDELGDGLKSLFYISLVNSLLTIEEKITEELLDEGKKDKSFKLMSPVCTILALEEPENHISPQLLGKVVSNIKEIANKKNCQAVVSSHSPSIISRMDPEDIRHFRINEDTMSTTINKLDLPPKDEQDENVFKYIKNGIKAYPELYFSKLVILGEGDSEEIILPKMLELDGYEIDSKCISMVPLGGRHVNHFWRLLNKLNIPHITLLDLDRERYLGGWGRIKYVCEQLKENGKNDVIDLDKVNMLGELDKMHEWDVKNVDEMNKWIKHLESYDVYFSAPLDIDFLMLKYFKKEYINILEGNEGPKIDKIGRIKDITDKSTPEYINRIYKDMGDTLKEKCTDGATFSEEEKELMIWYKYFFLTRGKPTTHRRALLGIDDEFLKDNMPEVFKNINSRVMECIN